MEVNIYNASVYMTEGFIISNFEVILVVFLKMDRYRVNLNFQFDGALVVLWLFSV